MLPATQAQFFNNVMQYIWGDNDPPQNFTVRAVGDRLRGTQRINPENALDVLQVLGPPKTLYGRTADDSDSTTVWHITFEDNSQVIIEAPQGIGSGVEVV